MRTAEPNGVATVTASAASKPGSAWVPDPVMIPIDMAGDANEWVVLYDSDCGFCRWSLGRLLRFDRSRRLRPVALGTPAANVLLQDMPEERRAASWHLVSPSGERTSGGAAAPSLLRLLPRGRIPAAAMASAPRLTERAYRWIADHRSSFSRAIPSSAKRRADVQIALRQNRPR